MGKLCKSEETNTTQPRQQVAKLLSSLKGVFIERNV